MKESKTNIVTKRCPYCGKLFECYWDIGFVIHKEWCKKRMKNEK